MSPHRIGLERELGRRSLEAFIGFRFRAGRATPAGRMAWAQVEPNPLTTSWHMGAMCECLTAVSRGQIRKLLINVPPGGSKSLTVATLWPSWDWIDNATRRFIFATYAQNLSDKNARMHRNLVQSEWYQARWPETQIDPESTKKVREFVNTAGGWRFSSSVGGEVTGRHGDVLCFDDLVKAQDAEGRAIVDPKAIEKANDFWFKTMHTRRADPSSTIHVGIMQRLHEKDAAAKCIEKGDYAKLILPMEYDPPRKCQIYVQDGRIFSPPEPELDEDGERVGDAWEPPEGSRIWLEDPRTEPGELLIPDRFPREVVEADKIALGPQTYEAQMQQNPTPRGGLIFKVSKFQTWTKLPPGLRKIITVDCAFKDRDENDQVAIQCWGVKNPNYYLCDQILERLDVNGTMEQIGEMKDRWPRSVGIYVEDKANGPAVLQILGDTIPGLQPWSPGSASKVSRAEAVSPLVDAGNVWLPDPNVAGWVRPFKVVAGKFPLVAHDDEIDAMTMALLILHKPRNRRYRDAVKKMLRG